QVATRPWHQKKKTNAGVFGFCRRATNPATQSRGMIRPAAGLLSNLQGHLDRGNRYLTSPPGFLNVSCNPSAVRFSKPRFYQPPPRFATMRCKRQFRLRLWLPITLFLLVPLSDLSGAEQAPNRPSPGETAAKVDDLIVKGLPPSARVNEAVDDETFL